MAVSIPSGLGGSFGVVPESTVGTKATVTRWHRFDKEGFQFKKTTAQSQGLHQGMYLEGKRRNLVQKEATGAVTLDLQNINMGSLFKQMLGASTSTANGAAAASKVTTYYPADLTGTSMSVEVGRPQIAATTGTLQSFYYTGAKITDWTIGVQRGQLAKVDLTFDAWLEDVTQTYTAPTFLATNNIFDFSQAALLLGTNANASTSSNKTSIASAAAPTAVIQSVTLKGTNPLNTGRFTIGSQTKKEQLLNGFRPVDVEVQAEFANLTDFYTSLFATDTGSAVQLKFTGGAIPTGGGDNYLVDIVMPYVFWDEDPMIIQGPDVIVATIKGVALDDGTNNVINITTDSTEGSPNT